MKFTLLPQRLSEKIINNQFSMIKQLSMINFQLNLENWKLFGNCDLKIENFLRSPHYYEI